jgi:DeoR family ulaG and ulaABCDEF operon transcriptional repressor
MHALEREDRIRQMLESRRFVSLQDLCDRLDASPATVRRDLDRLERAGRVERVRGGVRLSAAAAAVAAARLAGTPFDANLHRHLAEKRLIGAAAAALCTPGEPIIIDGGTTTLQMCPHLAGLGLQVLTNTLHIVNELLDQEGTRVSVPSGAIFREQNIILSPFEDDGLARVHAAKMFMGAAAVGARGVMQADVILVQAERKLMARADEIVLLVDSSKFRASASLLVCAADEIDTLVTDAGASEDDLAPFRNAGVRVVIAR